jgi:maleate isomerase
MYERVPRARIGMIYPASGLMENEFSKLAPPSVTVHVTRIRFQKATIEDNLQLIENVEESAELLASAKVNLILFNCTTGSLAGGKGYDDLISKKIEGKTGIQALTTSTSVLLALKVLQLRDIAILAPYPEEVIALEKKFLEQNGYRVLWSYGANISSPIEQAMVNPSVWVEMATKKIPEEVDGLFISCSGIQIVERINEIEEALGKPVITSNQASMWACLRRLSVDDKTSKFGKLMRDF